MKANDYIGASEQKLSTTTVDKLSTTTVDRKVIDCIRIFEIQKMRIVILQTKVLDIP